MDAYERLLGDAMEGDATFARQDSVEAAWAIVQPILQTSTPLHEYEPGSWGPEQAARLAMDVGRLALPDLRGAHRLTTERVRVDQSEVERVSNARRSHADRGRAVRCCFRPLDTERPIDSPWRCRAARRLRACRRCSRPTRTRRESTGHVSTYSGGTSARCRPAVRRVTTEWRARRCSLAIRCPPRTFTESAVRTSPRRPRRRTSASCVSCFATPVGEPRTDRYPFRTDPPRRRQGRSHRFTLSEIRGSPRDPSMGDGGGARRLLDVASDTHPGGDKRSRRGPIFGLWARKPRP